MPDANSAAQAGQLWEYGKYVITVVLAVFAWIIRRQIHRIDALEEVAKKSITHTELTEAINSLRTDFNHGIDRMIDETRHQGTRIDKLYQRNKED